MDSKEPNQINSIPLSKLSQQQGGAAENASPVLQKSLENNISPSSKGAKEDEQTISVNNAPKDNETSKTLSTAGMVNKQAVATNAANEAVDSLPEKGVEADRKVSNK